MIMMNHSQQSQSLLYVAALASLLMIATRFQSCIALHLQSERPDDGATCADRDNYYGSTYATIDSGLKVMDALRAQTSFIRKTDIEISKKFLPSLPGKTTRSNENEAATIKSVIDVIKMKESYEALNEMNPDPQLALAQLLLGKVAEETCLWLNESPDIDIPDCTNIDLSILERIYHRMELYQTLQSTFNTVKKLLHNPSHHPIHTCAWMNHRVLDNCAAQNTNYGYRDTLNKLCDRQLRRITPPGCDPHLCTQMS